MKWTADDGRIVDIGHAEMIPVNAKRRYLLLVVDWIHPEWEVGCFIKEESSNQMLKIVGLRGREVLCEVLLCTDLL